MLYATGSVTADAATTRIAFAGVPAPSAGAAADLLGVVPGGNKGQNTLTVNGHAFPGIFAGSPYPDLAIATIPVGPYLRTGSNSVTLRDEGDYIVPGLFVLRIAGGAPASTTAPGTATATPTATGTTGQPTTLTQAATTRTPTATMTATTSKTSPTATATAAGGTAPTFPPGITIQPSATGTAVPTTPAENATPTPTPVTSASAPVVIVGGNDTPAAVDVNATTAPVETTVPTTEPTTIPTTDPTTVPTTDPTTVSTTEPTTTATTVTAPAADPVVLGGPADVQSGPFPTPTTPNASALAAGGGTPPFGKAGLALPSSGTELVGLGITVFWLCVGAGIVTASTLVGAGVASRIGRAGSRGAGSDGAIIGEGTAPAARFGRSNDDR
jgi:hypothetical protein